MVVNHRESLRAPRAQRLIILIIGLAVCLSPLSPRAGATASPSGTAASPANRSSNPVLAVGAGGYSARQGASGLRRVRIHDHVAASWAARVERTAGTAHVRQPSLRVRPGQRWSFASDVKARSGSRARVRVLWRTHSGRLLSVSRGPSRTLTARRWTRVTARFRVPARARFGRTIMNVTGPGRSSRVLLTQHDVRRLGMTPTPTTNCSSYQSPLRITTGGVYAGCYQSLSANTPAVTIATTQPVTLDGMTVRHAGVGVEQGTSRINVTVTNSSFTAMTSSAANPEQQAIRLYQPAGLIVEHNSFTDGHGIQINGEATTINTYRVSYNNFLDIGRISNPGYYQGAIHNDKVTAPGGQILWNRVTNHYGKGGAEDVISLAASQGAVSKPIEVAYNLVNGAYPYSGDGANFTGGAFDFADVSGGYISAHNNYAVNYTNNGFMIPTGTEIYIRDSVAINDGLSDSGVRVSSPFGNSITTWNNSGYAETGSVGVTNNRGGQRRWTGSNWERADYYLPIGSNSGNTSITSVDDAAERAAVSEFEQLVKSRSVTIGPM